MEMAMSKKGITWTKARNEIFTDFFEFTILNNVFKSLATNAFGQYPARLVVELVESNAKNELLQTQHQLEMAKQQAVHQAEILTLQLATQKVELNHCKIGFSWRSSHSKIYAWENDGQIGKIAWCQKMG